MKNPTWPLPLKNGSNGSASSRLVFMVASVGGVTLLTYQCQLHQSTLLDARVPIGGELIQSGKPVEEKSTGILFPQLCNGYYLAGCGARAKWGLIKVYAVGTYMDPLAMSAVKTSKDKSVLEKALLDPTYPRTIRIVMARALSVEKFTSAIIEALEPRMNGQDLEKLDEFKALMPPVNLIKGAEMEMTIRGDTLLFKNPTGGVGTIRSRVFTEAMCDVYYGSDAVSPSHKESVLEGIPNL